MYSDVKKNLGELLLESGKLTSSALAQAVEKQKNSGKRLSDVLIESAAVKEDDIVFVMSVKLQLPFIKIESYNIKKEVLNLMPKGLAGKFFCLPLDKVGDVVSFVIADPSSIYSLRDHQAFLNCKMQFFVTLHSQLKSAIQRYYGVTT